MIGMCVPSMEPKTCGIPWCLSKDCITSLHPPASARGGKLVGVSAREIQSELQAKNIKKYIEVITHFMVRNLNCFKIALTKQLEALLVVSFAILNTCLIVT